VGRKPKERSYNKVFGPFVRQLRQEKLPEMTIADFAESVGITGPYLSNIENCKVPPPSEAVVRAIAEKLEQDVDLLLAYAGYFDLSVFLGNEPVDKSYFTMLKLMKFMKGKFAGSSSFVFESIAAFLIGRALEERRVPKKTELLSELFEQMKHLVSEDNNEFPDEFKPTLDRGFRALSYYLEKAENAEMEKQEKTSDKKAKRK